MYTSEYGRNIIKYHPPPDITYHQEILVNLDLIYTEEFEVQAYFQLYIAIHKIYGANLPPQALSKTAPIQLCHSLEDEGFDCNPRNLTDLLVTRYEWKVVPIDEWFGAYQYIPPDSLGYPFEIVVNTRFPPEDMKEAYYQLYLAVEENYLRI